MPLTVTSDRLENGTAVDLSLPLLGANKESICFIALEENKEIEIKI